jgi:hypothetical protein
MRSRLENQAVAWAHNYANLADDGGFAPRFVVGPRDGSSPAAEDGVLMGWLDLIPIREFLVGADELIFDRMASILLFGLAANTDNLTVGVAYGMKCRWIVDGLIIFPRAWTHTNRQGIDT